MERIKLVEICNPKQWKTIPTGDLLDEGYPVYGANGVIGYYGEYNHENPVVAITCRGATCGSINITVPQAYVTGNAMCLDDVREDINIEYLYYCLKHFDFNGVISGSAQPQITRQGLNKVDITICSPEEQQVIVEKLKRVELIIKYRKNEMHELDNLIKARFVELFGNVQNEEKYKGIPLRKLCTTMSGGTPSTKYPEYYEGDIPWISTVSLGPNHIDGSTAKGFITQEAIDNSATKLIPAGNILFGTRVGVGKSSLNDVDICTNQDIVAIVGIDDTKYNRLFIKHVLDSYQPYYDSIKKGATILGITGDDLKDTLIPDAPISIQLEFEQFVKQVDKSKVAVQKALNETRKLFDSLMQEYFG